MQVMLPESGTRTCKLAPLKRLCGLCGHDKWHMLHVWCCRKKC